MSASWSRLFASLGVVVALAAAPIAAQDPAARPQRPARDAPPQERPKGTASLTGRIFAMDTGAPMKRVAVRVTAPELREGRAGSTDAEGRYAIEGLPAGRYTITASKPGFVTLSYGQRHPLGAGTPVTLRDGERLVVDLKLPRGGVIAGRIFDEDGEPVPAANVRVLRLQYQQGERQPVPLGGDQTDDRGAYRVYGLGPGEYVVSATVQERWLRDAAPAAMLARREGGGLAMRGRTAPDPDADEDVELLAPTYHPGTVDVHDAGRIALALGAELTDVDIHLQLVRTSTVRGTLVGPAEGVTRTLVLLVPEARDARGRMPLRLGSFSASASADGTFTIARLPPGRYVLIARASAAASGQLLFASQPLTLAGQSLANLSVALGPGATISGQVELQGGSPSTSLLRGLRIGVQSPDPIPLANEAASRVGSDGSFAVDGVPAGRYLLRVSGMPKGWALRAVVVNGVDVTDTPVDVAGGGIANVRLVLVDRTTRLSGTVRDDSGQPAPFATVVAFADDSTRWGPTSRYVQAVQPDQSGAFQISGLPPATYLLVAADSVERGEWLDPSFLDQMRPFGERLTLGDGEVKNQDLKLKTR